MKKTMDAKTRIKTMIIEDPQITTDEIMMVLERDGVQISSLAVSSIRSNFRHSLRLLQGMNLLKVKLDLDVHGRPTKEKRHNKEVRVERQRTRLQHSLSLAQPRSKPKRKGGDAVPKRSYRTRTWWPDG
jgi:hypothetical protein